MQTTCKIQERHSKKTDLKTDLHERLFQLSLFKVASRQENKEFTQRRRSTELAEVKAAKKNSAGSLRLGDFA
ncbi:hypothetical protein HUU40_30535 [candidate division KSB1 bacterium]|nr:hypothetical protein [candidate division KSB1 bacterium]